MIAFDASLRWVGDDACYVERPGPTSPAYPGHGMRQRAMAIARSHSPVEPEGDGGRLIDVEPAGSVIVKPAYPARATASQRSR